MTARLKGLTVTLERDIREDDFQRIKEAVEMIVGVLHVEGVLATGKDHIIRTRLKHDITRNILKLIDETE
jgi:hypothetical protein